MSWPMCSASDGSSAAPQHGRGIVGEHEVAPVVVAVDDRLDVVRRCISGDVSTCAMNADDRHVAACRVVAGMVRHDVAVLVHAHVGEPEGRQFVDQDAQERQLSWRARAGSGTFVRAGVDDGVA